MGTVLLVLVVVLVVAALVFGVVSMLTGEDPGLSPVDPDGRAVPLPNNRSLLESDLKTVRFDVTLRGYRMSQVDRVLRRTAYDVGYKDEMIAVLEAEVIALRDGRIEDAEMLRKAREAASSPAPAPGAVATLPEFGATDLTVTADRPPDELAAPGPADVTQTGYSDDPGRASPALDAPDRLTAPAPFAEARTFDAFEAPDPSEPGRLRKPDPVEAAGEPGVDGEMTVESGAPVDADPPDDGSPQSGPPLGSAQQNGPPQDRAAEEEAGETAEKTRG